MQRLFYVAFGCLLLLSACVHDAPAQPNVTSVDRFGTITYTLPAGWTTRQEGPVLNVLPERNNQAGPVQLTLMPSLSSSGNLDTDADQSWHELARLYGTSLTYQVNQQPYTSVGERTTARGLPYRLYQGALRQGNQDYLVRLYCFAVADRVERIAVLAPEIRAGISVFDPSRHPTYDYALQHFIFGLRFDGEQKTGHAPGTIHSSGIQGVWAGSGFFYGGLAVSYAVFFDNGQVYFENNFPYEGFADRDTWTLSEIMPRHWGSYVLNQEAGRLTLPYDEFAIRLAGTVLIITHAGTEHRFSKLPSVDGLRFNATYGIEGPGGRTGTLTFIPDGRFADHGAVAVLEHASVSEPVGGAGGDGTYACRANTLLFTYSDGRVVRIAFPGLNVDPRDTSPDQLILGFNNDILHRLR